MAWKWWENVKNEYKLQRIYSKKDKLLKDEVKKERKLKASLENKGLSDDEKKLRLLRGYEDLAINKGFMEKYSELDSEVRQIQADYFDLNNRYPTEKGNGIGGFLGRLFSGRTTQKQRDAMNSTSFMKYYHGSPMADVKEMKRLSKERNEKVNSAIHPNKMDMKTLEIANNIYNDDSTSPERRDELKDHVSTYNNRKNLIQRGKKLQDFASPEKVKFSPALRKEIEKYGAKRANIINIITEYYSKNPVPADMKFDHRDLFNMCEHPDSMTNKNDIKKYVEDRAKAMASTNPEERKWVLDEFFNYVDRFKLDEMNMDVFTGKHPSNNEGKLTDAEKDALKILKRLDADQTITVKGKVENPEYFKARYDGDGGRFEASYDCYSYASQNIRTIFRHNGYDNDIQKLEIKEPLDEWKYEIPFANLKMQMAYQKQRAIEGATDLDFKFKMSLCNPAGVEPSEPESLEYIIEEKTDPLEDKQVDKLHNAFARYLPTAFDIEPHGKNIEFKDSIFIDGKPAKEKYSEFLEGKIELAYRDEIEGRIMNDILNGDHKVELGVRCKNAAGEDKMLFCKLEVDYSKLLKTAKVNKCIETAKERQANEERKAIDLGKLGPDKKENHNHLEKTNSKEVINTKKNNGMSMGHK